ncbi:GntR family transcriptional regulator [bacterium]|nr:GntR family transcriptional regulator [bacterium]
MGDKAQKSITLQDSVYKALFEDIISGNLPPGSKLNLRLIAKQYNVSIQPVREAVRRLEAEKMLSIDSRSITIHEMSREEIDQIFIVHTTNTILAFELAAENRTEEDLDRIRKSLDTLKAYKTSQEFFLAGRVFWLSTVRASNNVILYELISFYLGRMTQYTLLTYALYSDDDINYVHKQYENIYNAIKNRNKKIIKKLVNNLFGFHHKIVSLATEHQKDMKFKDYLGLIDLFKQINKKEKP